MSKAKYAYMIVLLQYALLKSHSVFNSPHWAADLFSLSWVSKTQPNPWTKPMTSAWLTTQDTRNCPGPEDRSLPTDNLRINVCVFLSTELTASLLKGFLLHRHSYTLKLTKAIKGYRSSLLETVRQAPTIVAQGGPSWAQYSHGWPLRNASIKKHMLTFLFLTFF